ncbi:MAG: efflux RND transporter periplasmic adaptor subunit [Planctomycetaceae bacterium]|nr:efflux RND transporter periplasmic adaptor subunit [Planctomycetaceae bacterium]
MTSILLLVASLGSEPRGVEATEITISGAVLTLIDQADVPAREAGVLMRLSVREGQIVEAGQLLGQIDDTDARLRETKAETEFQQARQAAENDIKVRFAKKSADVAQAELSRAEESAKDFKKSVSESEIDRLRLLADKAVLEIEQATIDLSVAGQVRDLRDRDRELAALSVSHRRIVAPLTGMVVQWRKHVGEWVEPGTAVVRVIRLNKLRAEGFGLASQLTPDSVGSKVTFVTQRSQESRQEFIGELMFVSPEIDPINGQVRFWAEIDNPKTVLRPGQMGELRIAIGTPAAAK